MKYRCGVCGYIYDDEKEKIPFNELSDDWVCPLCGASKDLFELVEDKIDEPNPQVVATQEDENVEITAKELAIIMANLKRGFEKQANAKGYELFSKLEDYFSSIKGQANEAKVSYIIDELNQDLKIRYPKANKVASSKEDRGSLRALTWNNKVSTMLKSILDRYSKEGNKMLIGKHIYVCTICGFVYIGDKAPELCPVCKVPSFKFEEVL